MARKNYYSVRKGKVTGIFKTWEECRDSIDGYPSAEFKGFATEKEAIDYLAAVGIHVEIPEQKKEALPMPEHITDKTKQLSLDLSLDASEKNAVESKKELKEEEIKKEPGHTYIYSDGSSLGNPGRGGYGAIIEYIDSHGNSHKKEISQGFVETTNNRMELMGVIAALEQLKRPCNITVVSDSQYVVRAINEHWLDRWQKECWGGEQKRKANVDLWKRLLIAMESHTIRFCWVKGHNGHPENERCDQLAVAAAQSDNLLADTEVTDDSWFVPSGYHQESLPL